MAESHFPQGLKVDLGIDRRGIWSAMTDEVTNGLEGQVSLH